MASALGLRDCGRPPAVPGRGGGRGGAVPATWSLRAQSPRAAAGAPQSPLESGSEEPDNCPRVGHRLDPAPALEGLRAAAPPPPTTAAALWERIRNPPGARPALFSREVGGEAGRMGDGDVANERAGRA
uniref:Uncharacterized protein n=1 Tax=Rangifer tarandus platyrhynchus TaxID=3082113 RepID=A0ACB0FKI2_RANTA|nr:unnamed protein product [Rangifer tarandus platyrhynchus]